MGQPLTLDEVGVAEADAAQVIYDLRRRCTAMEDTVRRQRDLLVDVRAEVDRFHWAILVKIDAELGGGR